MVKIAYITGCGHSGTTLLHRILGAHPDAINVGGIKHLASAVNGTHQCRCGAPSLAACSFWSRVDAELRRRGERLETLDPRATDDARFDHDNRVVFEAVADAAGARVVIDSSRQVPRLARLREVPGVDVTPIHVIKDPRAQFSSHVRRGRSGYRGMRNYVEVNLAAMRLLRTFDTSMTVSYESLCRDPKACVDAIFERLGLAPAPDVLATWGGQPVHVFGGNRMVRSTSSAISLDQRWRERLSPFQKGYAYVSGGLVHRAAVRRAVATSVGGRALQRSSAT